MKIFLSWSGEQSKAVAVCLKEWLVDIIQSVDPWVSEHDIQAGSRWNADVDRELDQTNFGIICLTKENLEKPWILFEAGSLAKSIDIAKVVPYRLGVLATDVKPPLSQFQGVDATKEGTLKLIKSINDASQEPLEDGRITRLFEKFWPDLETQIIKADNMGIDAATDERDDIDYLKEILELVRQISSVSRPPPLRINKADDNNRNEYLDKMQDLSEDELNKKIIEAEEYDFRYPGSKAALYAEVAREFLNKKFPPNS